MLLIIGGSGFIGTRLCKRFFSKGIEFHIIDKLSSKTFPEHTTVADIRSLEQLRQAMPDTSPRSPQSWKSTIINLAAEHRDDVTPRSLYDEVNVQGARNVCRAAEEKGIYKIIFTSFVAVYGFAPIGTDESEECRPFNDYGRTKLEAEYVYKEWQAKEPDRRILVIVRPTVVFGEQNRGNVYNLLNQIAKGRFMMVGNGKNVKSMAYVENVAAFLEHTLSFPPGVHIYNYVDKPDFDMNTLVKEVYNALGRKDKISFRLPYALGYIAGKLFDAASSITGRKFPVSSIRIKKFCSNTSFAANVSKTGFIPPVSLQEGLYRTIKYEFIDRLEGEVFYTE